MSTLNILLLVIASAQMLRTASERCENNPFTIIRKSRQDLEQNDQTAISAVLEECLHPADAKCSRNLLIRIRIDPKAMCHQNKTFAIIDEAYNARSRTKQKLVNPFLIEIGRTQFSSRFSLKHSQTFRCEKCKSDEFSYDDDEADMMETRSEDDATENQRLVGGKITRNSINFERIQNHSMLTGPVDSRPKIHLNEKKMKNSINARKQKFGKNLFNSLPETEIMENFEKFPFVKRIPFSADFFENEFDGDQLQYEQEETSPNKKKNKNRIRYESLHYKNFNHLSYGMYNIDPAIQVIRTPIRIFQKYSDKWFKIMATELASTHSSERNQKTSSITIASDDNSLSSSKRAIEVTNKSLLLSFHSAAKISQKSGKRFAILKPPTDVLLIGNAEKLNANTKRKSMSFSKSELINELCEVIMKNKLDCNDVDERNVKQGVTMQNGEKLQASSFEEFLNSNQYGNFSQDDVFVERCQTDQRPHVCLNIAKKERSAYSIKIQFAFGESGLVSTDNYNGIHIATVVTDGTSEIPQVTANVINYGSLAYELEITIHNCDVGNNKIRNIGVSQRRLLLPNKAEVIDFQLENLNGETSAKCNIYIRPIEIVSSIFQPQIITKREFSIKQAMRCICMPNCDCKCIKLRSQGSHLTYKCLNAKKSLAKRFIDRAKIKKMSYIRSICIIVLLLFSFTFSLGLLKAIIGLCSNTVRNCGYQLLQNGRLYDSKTRHFIINLLFFICLPFVCCRRKQRAKDLKAEEEKLLVTDYWELQILQQNISGDDTKDDNRLNDIRNFSIMTDDDEEETILSKRIQNRFSEDKDKEEEKSSIEDYDEQRRQRGGSALCQYGIEYCNTLDSHCEDIINPQDVEDIEAARFIQQLFDAKIVYRTLNCTVGGVDTIDFQQYSLRGYFLMDEANGYKFITPIPTWQYNRINLKDRTLSPIHPPLLLNANALTKSYSNRQNVLRQADLSLNEPCQAPCINMVKSDVCAFDSSREYNGVLMTGASKTQPD